jgi:hypothetical protein
MKIQWSLHLIKLVIIFLTSIILLPWNAHAQSISEKSLVELDQKTLHFSGKINKDSAGVFFDIIKNPISVIVIDSVGGDAKLSTKMAQEVAKRNITVIVKNRCFSGCTYIFLAGDIKIISPGSEFGFHGSSYSIEVEQQTDDLRKQLSDRDFSETEISSIVSSSIQSIKKYKKEWKSEEFKLSKLAKFDQKLFEVMGDRKYIQNIGPLKSDTTVLLWWPSEIILRNCFSVTGIIDLARSSMQEENGLIKTKYAETEMQGDRRYPNCDSFIQEH